MPQNGHLNGSHARGQKFFFFLTPKMEFPGFPGFGLCRGRRGSQRKCPRSAATCDVSVKQLVCCERAESEGLLT